MRDDVKTDPPPPPPQRPVKTIPPPPKQPPPPPKRSLQVGNPRDRFVSVRGLLGQVT